jgi:hypothetical protein
MDTTVEAGTEQDVADDDQQPAEPVPRAALPGTTPGGAVTPEGVDAYPCTQRERVPSDSLQMCY